MANCIKISTDKWNKLRKRLKEEYSWKPSVFAITSVMRRELGFSPRLHSEFYSTTGYTEVVYLDFFDDHLETLFRLKYAEYLS